ncbi:OmpH family outer membrane protein [Alistipes finegoldii]|uniref:OmpH family outer membrane protein n=1 Tax=Alistipes finegoldii TaxID=214856 RepID=UPI00256F04DC|nr:OmpH family outer membrane protein [Alistipes finegoldii]
MKKAIKLTLAVVFVMGATSLFAQQKFGRINTQEIIVGMPETKEMQTNMEAYAKDLQDNLESMTVEYNQKLQEFQKNFNTLSESVRQLKENDLNALIQRRNEFEQAAQQDFQKRQNELLAPIIQERDRQSGCRRRLSGRIRHFDGFARLFRRGFPYRHRPRSEKRTRHHGCSRRCGCPRSQEIESLREYPDMKKAPAIPAPFSCPSPSGDQKRHKAVHFVRR